MSNGHDRSRQPSTPTVPATPQHASSNTQRQVNGSYPSQSSDGQGQALLNSEYVKELCLRLSSCNTMGELLKLLPVPVQPISRGIFDDVYQASQKLGSAQALLLFWQDRLRSARFADVPQLNSLKAPTVQVCKEAQGPDDGGLSSMNLDNALLAAKECALTQMIAIKSKEVDNLRAFVQPQRIAQALYQSWGSVVQQNVSTITTEHQSLLSKDEVIRKVAQVAAAIGESSSQRAKIAKDKRADTRKEADVDMTDVSSGQSKKQLASVIEEVLKRREQSRRDRTQAGKGKRSSGISKRPGKKPKKTQKQERPPKKKGGPRNDKNKGSGAKRRERR